MNTKLHAVTDANGRPISFFMTAGQVSDYTGAAALLDSLPKAQRMLADHVLSTNGPGFPPSFPPTSVIHAPKNLTAKPTWTAASAAK